MPGGIPVATFGIGKPGALNAAIFACQMMALSDEALAGKLAVHRAGMSSTVEQADDELQGERSG